MANAHVSLGVGAMKNGLYSIHVRMLDGHPDRGSGVLVVCDGDMLGGNGSLYYTGNYTCEGQRWKGELITSPHTRNPDRTTVFEDRDSGIGFSGTFEDDRAEARGTALLGKTSLTFRVTLRWLCEL
jgi:hypothetical protein